MTLGVTSLLVNDDLAVMTMPGEPFHRLQVEFRQKAGMRHAFVFGYCSNGPYDWPSYLPDIESAAFGGYGASDMTHVEVGAPERLVLKGLEQVYTLQGRSAFRTGTDTNEYQLPEVRSDSHETRMLFACDGDGPRSSGVALTCRTNPLIAN